MSVFNAVSLENAHLRKDPIILTQRNRMWQSSFNSRNVKLCRNLLDGLLDPGHVDAVWPQEADQLDRVSRLTLNPQERAVHVVLATSNLTPRDTSLKLIKSKYDCSITFNIVLPLSLLIESLQQRCPTLSPFATCGDKRFKCGDGQFFRTIFSLINAQYFA